MAEICWTKQSSTLVSARG